MGLHQTGVVIDIVGINASSNGRSCEEHQVCGSGLRLDSLVRFREVQIIVKGKEETALVVLLGNRWCRSLSCWIFTKAHG